MANYDISKVVNVLSDEAIAAFHMPRGNGKTGIIPAFNIAPVITCPEEACRTCALEGCYALKVMLRCGYDYSKNAVLRAYLDNTRLAFDALEELEARLDEYLTRYEITGRLFRIHSAGEFFSVDYARMWYRLAEKHSAVKFLAFTKAWSVVRAVPFYELDNFSLVLSGWTGITIPADLLEHYRAAVCVERGQEPPEGALECGGNCDKCGMCWHLKEIGRDVYFNKH